MADSTNAPLEVTGGCHCGAVRFHATVRDRVAVHCNCSICRSTGFVHVIVPESDFTLDCGADALTEYRFGTGAARHLFCRTCGVKSFYVPRSHPDGRSMHLGCLDVDAGVFERQDFDGANWERSIGELDGATGV